MGYEYPNHPPMVKMRNPIAVQTFHLFTLLPTELRLKIWKLALPGPRVVEVTVKSPERPEVEYGTSQGNAPNLRWFWIIKGTSPALLYVNHEARDVTLESYETPGAWDTNFSPWRRAYMDYKVDTLYLSTLLYKALLFSRKGSYSKFDTQSIDLHKVQSLALDSWLRMRQSEEPGLRAEGVSLLQFVFKVTPGLKELLLVMDGRTTVFNGPDRLVDPTDKFPDYIDLLNKQKMITASSNKQKMLQLVDDVVKDTTELLPMQTASVIPQIKLMLLINGPENPPIERRWFYGRNCCETYAMEKPLIPLGRNAFEYAWD